MARACVDRREERGVALVVAMLVLLVLTMLGVVMMASVAVNRQVAGIDMQRRKALDNAEAGVAEAIMRIRNNDVGMATTNPRATAQIFLAATGSIPVVGADTVAMATAQPAGNWLAYSDAINRPNDKVLTINYKTDAGRTAIYRYDKSVTPNVHLGGTGSPIYVITSTGTAGKVRRTIVTEVAAKPITINAKSALCAGRQVDFVGGNAVICGYDHYGNTPPDAIGTNGRLAAPDCASWEQPGGVGLPAVWATGSITGGGAAGTTSPVANQANQTGFYSGPWDMLSMSMSDFQSFIGPPTADPSSLNGLLYVDNDLILGNQSYPGIGLHGVTGEGMLYVDGDLTLNAGFVYTGLVYIEGDLNLTGTAWILGGLVVRGRSNVKAVGGSTILYSSEAIAQMLSKHAGQYITLSWREK